MKRCEKTTASEEGLLGGGGGQTQDDANGDNLITSAGDDDGTTTNRHHDDHQTVSHYNKQPIDDEMLLTQNKEKEEEKKEESSNENATTTGGGEGGGDIQGDDEDKKTTTTLNVDQNGDQELHIDADDHEREANGYYDATRYVEEEAPKQREQQQQLNGKAVKVSSHQQHQTAASCDEKGVSPQMDPGTARVTATADAAIAFASDLKEGISNTINPTTTATMAAPPAAPGSLNLSLLNGLPSGTRKGPPPAGGTWQPPVMRFQQQQQHQQSTSSSSPDGAGDDYATIRMTPGAWNIPGSTTNIQQHPLEGEEIATDQQQQQQQGESRATPPSGHDVEEGLQSSSEVLLEQHPSGTHHVVEAVAVEEEDEESQQQRKQLDEVAMRAQIEEEIRNNLLQSMVQATNIIVDVNTNTLNTTTAANDDCVGSGHDSSPTSRQLVVNKDEKLLHSQEVQAEVKKPRRKAHYCIAAVVVAVILALGLGLGLTTTSTKEDKTTTNTPPAMATSTSTSSPQATEGGEDSLPSLAVDVVDDDDTRSTLDIVRERGYVRCGLDVMGFVSPAENEDDDEQLLEGFNVEQCKAIAFLALGDFNKYEQVLITSRSRFDFLANKTIDVLTEGTTYNMERDVYHRPTTSSFTFTTPYYYSGLRFGGVPAMVDCAEAGEDFYQHCRDLQICVAVGTTYIDILRKDISIGHLIVPVTSLQEGIDNLNAGKCNVAAAGPGVLSLAGAAYQGEEWKIGSKSLSKEPLALVTRQGDPEWSAIANLAVDVFITAEALGITKDNAHDLHDLIMAKGSSINYSKEDTEELSSMLTALIAEFGNHGDLYHEHIELGSYKIPRNGLNTLYDMDQSSGLLYSFPLGNIGGDGRPPVDGGSIQTIMERGHLICGVSTTSRGPGFAATLASISQAAGGEDINNNTAVEIWSGFDVEFCRGLAASLFRGNKEKILFVDLQDAAASYDALADGEVDVVAGARVTLQARYKEPATGESFAFSTPYYYDNESHDAFAFMTSTNDTQWNDFVNWMVMATIYAEEEGITADVSADMPVVDVFGQELKQMFRDCISQVGNYAELYNSTLQEYIPRAGANMLNEGKSGPQLFPIPII